MSKQGSESDMAHRGQDLVDRLLRFSVDGKGKIPGAREVADAHLRQHGEPERAIDRTIRTHIRILGASGFVTGAPGLLLMPVTVPADVFAMYYFQTRMVLAIAHLRGYDIDSEEVRSLAMLTLLGSSATEVLSKVGVEIGTKSALSALKKVPGSVFIQINKRVGFRLITKAGTKGVVNMTKLVPLAGGVVGGGINLASTSGIAKYAKKNFEPSRDD